MACNLNNTKLLDCALKGVCEVTGSNTISINKQQRPFFFPKVRVQILNPNVIMKLNTTKKCVSEKKAEEGSVTLSDQGLPHPLTNHRLLDLNGPVNIIKVMSSWSVYLHTFPGQTLWSSSLSTWPDDFLKVISLHKRMLPGPAGTEPATS